MSFWHFANLVQKPHLIKKVIHFIVDTEKILLTFKILSKGIIQQRQRNKLKKGWMWKKEQCG